MGTESRWVGAHVLHQGDQDPLLVEAVLPLAEALAAEGLADAWFFLRHWDGGLHVRLRVRCAAADEARVRDRIVAGCTPYLRAHPSTHRTTPGEYAVSAAKLAALEGAVGPARPLGPPDGVEFVPYHPETRRYGIAAGPLERHFAESSRLVADLLRTRPPTAQRDTAALALLLLAWFAAEPEPGRLAPAVAGDATPPDPQGGSPALWRAAVDRRYRAQRERLAGLALRMHAVAVEPAAAGREGLFGGWTASLGALRAAAGTAAPALPLLDRVAHLACNRLGVSLVEEGYLRLLAARTVHTLAGVPV